ncbi:DNA mismatch repair endonuclease MutH [Flocculibacter collagenilyticus]|uniref:DNA mismatch repair endonuclease MutH n=1 Tax=Flocculibacter collagenilyticus TaxID=2744479 RepID=UPI0018F5B3EB|nr:DNA mismatch repair endonuclease MutH [Flocculibacter collagenilyticus]
MTSSYSQKPTPPQSENELLERCNRIAGHSIAELAQQFNAATPKNLVKDKGWLGQMLEHALGASAASRPEPDFPQLGIELKTLPITPSGKPLETTYVSITPLINVNGLKWHQSNVYKKLRRILWVPIVTKTHANETIPLSQRIIATPFIWSPSEAQMNSLKADWEEIMEMIATGEVESITARIGTVMQLRPKGANAKALTNAIGKDGTVIQTLPKGFYLKTEFTKKILAEHFSL